MAPSINPIEESVLQELLDLFTDDNARESHAENDDQCLLCAKLEVIDVIKKYRELARQLEKTCSISAV